MKLYSAIDLHSNNSVLPNPPLRGFSHRGKDFTQWVKLRFTGFPRRFTPKNHT